MRSEICLSYTVVLAGDAGTGKTSLITRMEKDEFVDAVKSGVAGKMTPIVIPNVQGKKVRLMIWDTPGREENRFLTSCQFGDAQAIVLVYSLESLNSLEHIADEWIPLLNKSSNMPHLVFIVGNKLDIEESRREVRNENVDQIASAVKAESVFVSAKEGNGVNELLLSIAERLVTEFPVVKKETHCIGEQVMGEEAFARKRRKRSTANEERGCQCLLV